VIERMLRGDAEPLSHFWNFGTWEFEGQEDAGVPKPQNVKDVLVGSEQRRARL
jgi:hypothetical protein